MVSQNAFSNWKLQFNLSATGSDRKEDIMMDRTYLVWLQLHLSRAPTASIRILRRNIIHRLRRLLPKLARRRPVPRERAHAPINCPKPILTDLGGAEDWPAMTDADQIPNHVRGGGTPRYIRLASEAVGIS